jgi:cellulose biosynthesis protein BcsQ
MAPLQVLTVCSNKGGVGKTTVATNLAVALQALDESRPVLLLSLDEQDLVNRMFGLETLDGAPTIVDAFRRRDLGSAIRLGQYGVHYIPADPAADELKREIDRTDLLRDLLEASGWDGLVVVDTKSDLEILTRNALAASHLVVLPVSDHPSLLEADKVFRLLDAWGLPRKRARILLSLIDLRVKYSEGESRDVLALLISEIRRRGHPLFETFLSRSPKIESLTTNTSGRVLPILQAARGSLVHRQLRALAADVQRILGAPSPAASPRRGHVLSVGGSVGSLRERRLLDVDELLGTGPPAETRSRPEVSDRLAPSDRTPWRGQLPVFRAGDRPIAICQAVTLGANDAEIERPQELRPGERVRVVFDPRNGRDAATAWAQLDHDPSSDRWRLLFEHPDEPARRAIERLQADARSGGPARTMRRAQ